MKSEQLVVSEMIGVDMAVSTDDGEKIFQAIDQLLKNNSTVELDFSKITIMTTAFLNAAIGQLYSAYEGEQLNRLLVFKNLSPENKVRVRQVVERAKEYFANKKGFEESANRAIYGE